MKLMIKGMTAVLVWMAVSVVYGDIEVKFDMFGDGTLDGKGGWTVTGTAANQGVEVTNTAAYGVSGKGVRFYDYDVSTARLLATHSLDAESSNFTFDYYCVTAGIERPKFMLQEGPNANVFLFLDVGGTVRYNDGALQDLGVGLADNQWYHIDLTTDIAASTFDLLITDDSGNEVINATDLGFYTAVANMGFTSMSFGQHTAGNSGEFYIDNVSVIPEPATLGLVGVTCIGTLFLRRFMLV